MTKRDIDKFAMKRPFEPFEIHRVNGNRDRFKSVEQVMVGGRGIVQRASYLGRYDQV